jgi:hypothetical protein
MFLNDLKDEMEPVETIVIRFKSLSEKLKITSSMKRSKTNEMARAIVLTSCEKP